MIQPSSIAAGVGATGVIFFIILLCRQGFSTQTRIPTLHNLPFLNAWQFFTKRHDFVIAGFAKVKQNLFKFYVNGVRWILYDLRQTFSLPATNRT
jgi:hypothetical protein